MVGFYIRHQVNRIIAFIAHGPVAQRITALALLGVMGLVAFVLYYLLFQGFTYVAADEFLQLALPLFIFELFLMTVMGLVFVSALITGTISLFQRRNDFWVMASPQYGQLLTQKALTVSLVSAWPVVVIAVPALAALQSVYAIGLGGIIVGVAAIILTGLLATFAALLLTVGAAWLLSRWCAGSQKFALLHAIVMISLVGVLLLYAWLPLRGLDVVTLFDAQNFAITEAGLTGIVERFSHLPSHYAASVLMAVQVGNWSLAAVGMSVLSAIVLLLVVLYGTFRFSFLYIWQAFQEGGWQASTRQVSSAKRSIQKFSGSPEQALWQKEWVLFSRSGRDLFWLAFLVGLWLLITSFDVFIQNTLSQRISEVVTGSELVAALQLMVIAYFVAAIVLRFVFPAFSQERDVAWNIVSAPVAMTSVLKTKALFYTASMVLLAVAVGVLHILILDTTMVGAGLFMLLVVVQTMCITLLGLCLGALFPNFSTTDPQILSTTVPGLSFTVLVLAYGAASSYFLYMLFAGASLWWLGVFVGGSVLVAAGVFVLASRCVNQLEFISAQES